MYYKSTSYITYIYNMCSKKYIKILIIFFRVSCDYRILFLLREDKNIWRCFFLISDKAAKEKEEAEIKSKEIIENRRNNNNAIPEKWELSKREKEIIKKLNKND